jgi:hypothetical protein
MAKAKECNGKLVLDRKLWIVRVVCEDRVILDKLDEEIEGDGINPKVLSKVHCVVLLKKLNHKASLTELVDFVGKENASGEKRTEECLSASHNSNVANMVVASSITKCMSYVLVAH